MVLVLLISLAALIWSIQRELDSTDQQALQAVEHCHRCRGLVDPEALVCPHCSEKLCSSCPHCHRGKFVAQRHCPFCGALDEERRAA